MVCAGGDGHYSQPSFFYPSINFQTLTPRFTLCCATAYARPKAKCGHFELNRTSVVYIRHTLCYIVCMASLTAPLSVRLSAEDTAFLAGLEMEGAVTASEKIRGLIKQARQRAETPASYTAALAVSHDQMASAVRAVRTIEANEDRHSDVVVGLMTMSEEFLALALATPRPGDTGLDDLTRHEAKLVDCATRMTEQLLRWAVTPTAPAYDAHVVSRRLAGLSDLMKLVCAASAAP